jgi:hypothetical protein
MRVRKVSKHRDDTGRLLEDIAVALQRAFGAPFLSEEGRNSIVNKALRVGNDRGGVNWFDRAGNQLFDVVVQVGARYRQDRGQSMQGNLHVGQWPSYRVLQILLGWFVSRNRNCPQLIVCWRVEL